MADIAGAWAAIEQRLRANWTDTKIAFANTDPDPAEGRWPPVDGQGSPAAWVYCEIVSVPAHIAGFGKPGSQTILEEGLIKLYVMVQKGSGLADARAKATALGEIYRQQVFYNETPGAYVRTSTPSVGQDPVESDDGNSVCGASCTIPYEFWHQA